MIPLTFLPRSLYASRFFLYRAGYTKVWLAIRQTETYAHWFSTLRDRQARARIDIRIRRLSMGDPGDVKPVGKL